MVLVLMVFNICTKFCRSISKGFRVMDLNSRVDTRVTDGHTDRRMDEKTDPYIAPCPWQAQQKSQR